MSQISEGYMVYDTFKFNFFINLFSSLPNQMCKIKMNEKAWGLQMFNICCISNCTVTLAVIFFRCEQNIATKNSKPGVYYHNKRKFDCRIYFLKTCPFSGIHLMLPPWQILPQQNNLIMANNSWWAKSSRFCNPHYTIEISQEVTVKMGHGVQVPAELMNPLGPGPRIIVK